MIVEKYDEEINSKSVSNLKFDEEEKVNQDMIINKRFSFNPAAKED